MTDADCSAADDGAPSLPALNTARNTKVVSTIFAFAECTATERGKVVRTLKKENLLLSAIFILFFFFYNILSELTMHLCFNP